MHIPNEDNAAKGRINEPLEERLLHVAFSSDARYFIVSLRCAGSALSNCASLILDSATGASKPTNHFFH
jgi:hypothetical protein